MNNKSPTENFYKEIMRKLIDKLKEEFSAESVPEENLTLLKEVKIKIKNKIQIWEKKMIEKGIFEPKERFFVYI